jgi:hypothetical protein
MTPEIKQLIDQSVADTEAKLGDLTNNGCWVLLRIDSKEQRIVGEPIAIFKNKESLYDKFEEFAKATPPEFNIIVAGWRFD